MEQAKVDRFDHAHVVQIDVQSVALQRAEFAAVIARQPERGQFVTIRQTTGADNRNAAGTTGTLQVVTPVMVNLTPFLNLFFGGTARVTFSFLPEPMATWMLVAGVAGVFAAHARGRRRR